MVTGKSGEMVRVAVRITPKMMASIDTYAKGEDMQLSEALQALLRLALKQLDNN